MGKSKTNSNAYRILSLDGGGSWAIIEVMCLQKLFGDDAPGHTVLKDYDLVVSNSGGSIVLAALAENMPLNKIVDLFNVPGTLQRLFKRTTGLEGLGDRFLNLFGFGPKYYTPAKLEGLQYLLPKTGGMMMTELPAFIGEGSPQLMIMGFDYDRLRADFFRSDKNSLGNTNRIINQRQTEGDRLLVTSNFDDVTLAEAVHASSNAPLNFFDRPAQFGFNNKPALIRHYWDGAVGGYNNPLLAGIPRPWLIILMLQIYKRCR
jgi:hypothetical protein